MSKNTFKIVYTGYLDPHADPKEFVAKFSKKFKVPPKKAIALVNAKKEILLKKGLSIEKAQKYHAALKKMGMIVRMDAEHEAATEDLSQKTTQIIPPPYEATEITPTISSDQCPSCGSTDITETSCNNCGHIFNDSDDFGETQVIDDPEQFMQAQAQAKNNKKHKTPPKQWLIISTGIVAILAFGAVFYYLFAME